MPSAADLPANKYKNKINRQPRVRQSAREQSVIRVHV